MDVQNRRILTQELVAFYTEERCEAMRCSICHTFNYNPVALDCACEQSLCYGCARKLARICPQCQTISMRIYKDAVVERLFEDWVYPLNRCSTCTFIKCVCEPGDRVNHRYALESITNSNSRKLFLLPRD